MIKKLLVLLTVLMMLPLGAIQLVSGQETTCPDGTVVPVGTACPGGTPPPTVTPCTCPDGYYSADCNCAGHETPYTPPASTGCQCSCGWSADCNCATMCPAGGTGGACVACPDGFYPNYASDPTCSCTGHQGTGGTTPSTGGCQCSCGWEPTCNCAMLCPAGGGVSCPCGWKYDDSKDCATFCAGAPIASTISCTPPNYRCSDGSCSVNNACPSMPVGGGCQCSWGWSPDCNCGTAGGGCQCSCGWSPTCNCATMCPVGTGCQCSCGWSADCRCDTMCGGASSCPSGEWRCSEGSCSVSGKCGCFCMDGRWSPDCMCGTSGLAAACPPGEWKCGNGVCSINGVCPAMAAAGGDGCPGCDQYGQGFQCAGRWISSCGGVPPPAGGPACNCPPCDSGGSGYDCCGRWVAPCGKCGPCKDCTWPNNWGVCPEQMMLQPVIPPAGAGCECWDRTWRDRCDYCPPSPPGWRPEEGFTFQGPMYDQFGRRIYEEKPVMAPPTRPVMMPPPTYQYEFKCPDMGDKEKACLEAKGKPISRLDPMGCPFIECDFTGMARTGSQFMKTAMQKECPSSEEMSWVKAKCAELGLGAVMEKMGPCSFVKCVDQGLATNYCPPGLMGPEEKEKCEAEGGVIIKEVTPEGCPIPVCKEKKEAKEFCQTAADVTEAFVACTENQGGEPVVRYDKDGCVEFFDCIVRGDERKIEFEDVEEIPPAARVLQAVLKLERLKIEFNELQKELKELADYWAGEGRAAEAEKFHRAIGMLQASQDKITGIEVELRDRMDDMTVDDIVRIKMDLKMITEVVFKDIVYVILAETAIEAEDIAEETVIETVTGEKIIMEEGGIVDCGQDEICFEKHFRTCKPAKFTPPGESCPPLVEIKGIETAENEGREIPEEVCILHAEIDVEVCSGGMATGKEDMRCRVPNFAFATLEPESIIPYCEGPMADHFADKETRRKGTDRVGMMGCAAVERGIAPRGVCGNGCCEEQYGESFETCGMPRGDCMAAGEFEYTLCPGAEEGMAECNSKGGRPITMPNADGTCELFDHCVLADELMRYHEQIGREMMMQEEMKESIKGPPPKEMIEMMRRGPPQGDMMRMMEELPPEAREIREAIGVYKGGCELVTTETRGLCGNGCCEEQYGESFSTCPDDCMGPEEGGMM